LAPEYWRNIHVLCKENEMKGLMLGTALLLLAGCGVSETAVTAAAGAAAKGQEAEAAKETQERVEARLEAATQQAQERLHQSEKAGY
jgi:uncharacterized lipoprotein YajG